MDLEVFYGISPSDSSDNCFSSAKSKRCAEGSDFGCSSLESSEVAASRSIARPVGGVPSTMMGGVRRTRGTRSRKTCTYPSIHGKIISNQ